MLVDQDNINQRRSEVIHHCSREQQQLADKTMSIAVLSNYTRTLNLMKDRLWIKQTTYQKTLDAYYVTLRAAKVNDCPDIGVEICARKCIRRYEARAVSASSYYASDSACCVRVRPPAHGET